MQALNSQKEHPSPQGPEAADPSRSRGRMIIQASLSIGLTVFIGYLIYRDVPDWRQSFKVMIQGDAVLLFAGLIFEFLHILFRAARWGALLSSAKPDIKLQSLFSLTLIKYVINVIPPRSGEVAASILLARKERISSATAIAASVFERVLDLFSIFLVFVLYLSALSFGAIHSPEKGGAILLSIRDYSIKGLFVFAAGLAVLLFLLRNGDWAARIPIKIRKPVLSFLDGFRTIQNQGVMFRVLLLSMAIWLCITLQMWFFVLSYVRGFPLSGAALLVVMTAAGVAIPTPAGVGGYQYFLSLALINFFGRHLSPVDPQTQAAGISNACYLASMIPVLIAGLVCLGKEGISFGRISGWRRLN